MIVAERTAREKAEAVAVAAQAEAVNAKAEAAHAQADLSSHEALVAHLKLEIEKLRRQLYGRRSERKERLLDQLELQLEELEAAATEDELAAEKTAGEKQALRRLQRRRPVRKPFPADIERERVVIASPTSCPCCGSMRLSKLGEDVTETLEVIPRRWKVIETVRVKFACRACEAITQPPAPFHATPRGFIGPRLLATILFDKFGQHLPLNRQSERFRCEGIDLSISTLADQVGVGVFAGLPLYRLIEAHVLAAERLHGDDTTIPILAKGKTVTGHIWTYVRDDRPFAGPAPPAAVYYASRDGVASIRSAICRASPASFRPMPIAASTVCTRRRPSHRLSVGRMPGGSSSNWPISPRTPDEDGRRRRSRRSRLPQSSVSMHCSTSSVPSIVSTPMSAGTSARRGAPRLSPSWQRGCVNSDPDCHARPPW